MIGKVAIFLLMSLAFNLPALAGGGSSVGPSACSYARYLCTSNDRQIKVCVYPDNGALIILPLSNGGSFSKMYEIQGLAIIGAITTFEYTEMTLKICPGFSLIDRKLPAYLTYGPAGLVNYSFSCVENAVNK